MPKSSINPEGIPSDAELFYLMMDNVKDYAVFVVDLNGKVAVWNNGAERILGYTAEEIIGQPCNCIFTPGDREKGEPERERESAAVTGRAEDERWHVRRDGSRFWASGIMTALRDEAGSLRGFVKILRDFTERKTHQDEIERLNQRLQRAMMETHHRVKNNLQVIAALVDMQIQTGAASVPMAEVKRIDQHLRGMASIHEMLTQQVKAHGQASSVAADEFLGALIPLLQQSLGERPLEIDIAPMRFPITAGCSLSILVNELVSNAGKHGAGKVTLSLHREGASAVLEVCDEGPGFPEGFTAQQAAHTGLELIEGISRFDMKGEVRFENALHGGACVRITFQPPDEL